MVSFSTGAHPHVCGEHLPAGQEAMARAGSSPRMRGTLGATRRLMMAGGLIPTYAGNTFFLALLSRRWRAHPHVCGEHGHNNLKPSATAGSSPRMRGTPRGKSKRRVGMGLIPTYAGNTLATSDSPQVVWAHPHVCGEHARRCSLRPNRRGSSPRMRGTRV